MSPPVGIYVSIPFCRAKCTFCHFASAAFPPERMEAYVDRLLADVHGAHAWAASRGLQLPVAADSLFLGGGTPSLLSAAQMERLLAGLRAVFAFTGDAEMTVEAAPGQIADDLLDRMLRAGVNRVSLGVQSFVDAECRAVGRLHTGAECVAEIGRLKRAGVPLVSVDLIAGLPLQTEASWRASLETLVGTGVDHASVYMLEVDEGSRLGGAVLGLKAESQLAVLGQQARYRADAVPDDDRCAAFYDMACERLHSAGLRQYEISNFGRPSRHNCKYWQRRPYLGFGLDAHSMLLAEDGEAVRFAQTDGLEEYLHGEGSPELERVDAAEAFEESVFLGLRMVEGIDLADLAASYGTAQVSNVLRRSENLVGAGLLFCDRDRLRLSQSGRSVSSAILGELLA